MDLQEFIEHRDPHYDLKQEIMTFKTEDPIDRFFGYKAVGELEDNQAFAYVSDKNAVKKVAEQTVNYVLIRKGEADTCPLVQEIYRALWSEDVLNRCSNVKFISGDTMNSASTTLKKFAKKKSDIAYIRSFKENETEERNALKSAIPFLKVCHTIGNMIPIPKNRTYGQACDYWDLFLLGIYNYYCGEQWNMERAVGIYSGWLDMFGDGLDGWDNFVDKNRMNHFVGEKVDGHYGMPKELWEGHFDGAVLPQTEQDCQQFFDNASKWIRERSKQIYEALKDNPKKEEQK